MCTYPSLLAFSFTGRQACCAANQAKPWTPATRMACSKQLMRLRTATGKLPPITINAVCVNAVCINTACVNAVCINAVCINAACINAACINAVCVNAVCINAACVNAACINAACINAACVNAAATMTAAVAVDARSMSQQQTGLTVASLGVVECATECPAAHMAATDPRGLDTSHT